MRISDWSSDVCSSDLCVGLIVPHRVAQEAVQEDVGLVHVAVHALRGGDRAREDVADRVPLLLRSPTQVGVQLGVRLDPGFRRGAMGRSEEHTSELQSLMRISYAVFCLKKKNTYNSLLPLIDAQSLQYSTQDNTDT